MELEVGMGRPDTIWAGTSPLESRPVDRYGAAGLSRSRNFISGPQWHEPAGRTLISFVF